MGLCTTQAIACSAPHCEFDLRHYINNPVAIVSVRAVGQEPHPERPGYQRARVYIERVLRGPDLPNGHTITATIVFQQQEGTDPIFERARPYIIGLLRLSDQPDYYSNDLSVYGGSGLCIGQMIYEPSSRIGAALTMVFDGESDPETEIEVPNAYIQASPNPEDSGRAAITMLFDGVGDQTTELEILHTFEQLRN